MCADIGHCDRNRCCRQRDCFYFVGVMCADIGHCDKTAAVSSRPKAISLRLVGVMCADIGHCDTRIANQKRQK